MSDQPPHKGAQPMAALPGDGAARAGAMLRLAREAAGVRLASLAASLKVPPGRIEALESGRLDLLPDPVFARALAASVCRSLKIDPEPVLKALPRGSSVAPLGQGGGGAAASAQFDPQQQRSTGAGIFSRPLVLGAIAFLIGTLVLVLLPELGRNRGATNQNLDAVVVSPAATSSVKTSERAAPTATVPSATGSTASAPQKPLPPGSSPAPASLAGETAVSTAVASSAPPVAAAATSAPSEPPASDTVVFRTQSEAWISVVDAKGTALLRKNVSAGQTVGVSGALPLKITVGRADVTQVSVRGEPMDLQSIMKGGVARFEVK